MTRKEAQNIVGNTKVFGPHYCSRYDYAKQANVSVYDLVELGYNSGVYGWNWSLYYDRKNDIYIIDSYRNAPALNYSRTINAD